MATPSPVPGILPSDEEARLGLLKVAHALLHGRPVPREVDGFDTGVLLQCAHDMLKCRIQEVEERDELIDELEAKIRGLEKTDGA